MRNSEYQYVGGENAVDQIVREAPHPELAYILHEIGANVGVFRQALQRVFHFGDQPVTKSGYATLEESRRIREVLLGFGKEDDLDHRFFSRARTRASAPAAGTA